MNRLLSPLTQLLFRLRLPGLCRLALLLLVATGSAFGQERANNLFPEARHRELREEVVFTPPAEKEVEPEKDPVDLDPFDGWEVGDLKLSKEVTYLILGILLLGIGFLVYRVLGDVELRQRTKKADDDQDEIRIDEIEEEALVASGVSLSLQERAENAGQFDIAVRLLYIQLLKDLQDNGLIRYRRDYSNRDYQIQLGKSELLPDFQDVTIDYERYWYGKYAIDPLSYRLVKRKFAALTSRVGLTTKTTSPYA